MTVLGKFSYGHQHLAKIRKGPVGDTLFIAKFRQ